MAASRCKHFLSTFSIFHPPRIRCMEGSSSYSMYSPIYQPPKTTKEELEEFIKTTDPLVLETIKLKAAENYMTCSVFYDEDVQTFTNLVMRKGKKELAEDLISKAFTIIKHQQLRKYYAEKNEEIRKNIILSPVEIFHLAVRNTTPLMKLKKIKKGGINYQVPDGIKPETAKKQAMRWLIEGGKTKPKYLLFTYTLAEELIAASKKEGKAFKKKLELHKTCEVNKGFAHLRYG